MDDITDEQVRRRPGRPRRTMPDGLAEPGYALDSPEVTAAIEANKPKMTPMLLKRNYRPAEDEEGNSHYEIVGHWTEPVKVRNVMGQVVEVEPSKFVDGKIAPPPTPGIGPHSTKLWAGTIAKFSREEALAMRKLDIASVEID